MKGELTTVSPAGVAKTAPPPKKQSWWWLYLLLALPVAGAMAFSIFRPITVLPRIGLSPGFTLRDQDGALVNNEAFRGQLTLYTFTYTQCDDDCPITPATLARLRQDVAAIAPEGLEVSLVTITLDPERDTSAALAAAAADLEAEYPAGIDWTWLTADNPAFIRSVVGNGFSLYYKAQDPAGADATDYRVRFDPRIVLVDGWGTLRAEYRVTEPDMAIIARDLRLLTEEAQNSEGTARLAYEAAHLFLCYPR